MIPLVACFCNRIGLRLATSHWVALIPSYLVLASNILSVILTLVQSVLGCWSQLVGETNNP